MTVPFPFFHPQIGGIQRGGSQLHPGFGQASKSSSQNGWMLRLWPSNLPTKASARQIIVRQNRPDLWDILRNTFAKWRNGERFKILKSNTSNQTRASRLKQHELQSPKDTRLLGVESWWVLTTRNERISNDLADWLFCIIICWWSLSEEREFACLSSDFCFLSSYKFGVSEAIGGWPIPWHPGIMGVLPKGGLFLLHHFIIFKLNVLKATLQVIEKTPSSPSWTLDTQVRVALLLLKGKWRPKGIAFSFLVIHAPLH